MTAVDDHALARQRARVAHDEDLWADLMPEAAELVVRSGLGSEQMLHRKMRVPMAIAGDLMVELHELGVVGPGDGAGRRAVLVVADGLADVLARIAEVAGDEAGASDEEEPPVHAIEPLVSLVKPAGMPLVVDVDDAGMDASHELAVRQPGTLVPARRHVQELVTRTRQSSARAWVRVVDEPLLIRSMAVARQAPLAGARLVIWTPRGAWRAREVAGDWLFASRAHAHVQELAEARSPEWEKASRELRALKDQLATRRWLVGIGAGVVALVELAWWAPAAFAGVLAVAVVALVIAGARGVCREPKELAWVALVALVLGWVAWWQGPDLAALVPRPPSWAWWVLAGVAVVVLGWLGRKEDQRLVEMPHHQVHDTSLPDRPTADMVIDALCRIGVTGMTLAASDRVRQEIRVRAPGVGRSTRGYTIELELPPGVTAAVVMENREEMAGALRRKLGCVWPSRGSDHPGHLRLFLSDVPMATAPQPEWPFTLGNPIDVFDPIPLVTDQEGEWVSIDVTSTHTVIAGASGFGKSVTLRHLAVALAFDPRARLYVFDGKISGDLDPVRKTAHAYYEGADEEDVAEQLSALRGLEKEMRRRARFLRDLPPEERSPKVTSALASKYPHLAPIFVNFDECQEYTEYGTKGVKEEMDIRLQFRTILTRLSRLGRSAGIFLVLVTQKPDADVLPTAIMGNCTNRLCFKVTEQNHNDQVLGTGAYKAGLKATLFSTDDRGLAWLKAAGDPQVVRGWSEMVDLQTAVDLVEIAYQLRKARGLLTGQAVDDGIVDAEVVYDIAADAEHVLCVHGVDKAQWEDLVPWLRGLREQYAALTKEELSAGIRAARVRVRDVRSGDSTRKGVYLRDLRKRDDQDDSI